MLFILGVIAFLQMTVIPGLLIYKYFRLGNGRILQSLAYIFGLSMAVNYVIVYMLTIFGIYTTLAVTILLAAEILLFIGYYLIFSENKSFPSLEIDINGYATSLKTFFRSNTLIYNVLVVLSIGVILLFIKHGVSNFMNVFYYNDAVLSWNRWALDWTNNHFPTDTWYYPQVLPSNWSMAYQIMRNIDLQFIPRNIMPLFPILTSFLFFDLALKKKNAAYLLGLIAYGIIMNYLFTPDFMVDGYMDIPVSFFAFLAFYVMHQMDSPSEFDLKTSYLSVCFASVAAGAKQAGLYILILILVWNIILFIKNKAAFSRKTILKAAGVIFLIIAAVVFSWYLHRMIHILNGTERAGIKTVIHDVHQGRNYVERVKYGYHQLLDAQGKNNPFALPAMGFAVLFLLFALFDKRSRLTTLLIVFPFIGMWALFFSYDYRNIALAIPFTAFSLGTGAHLIFTKIFRIHNKFSLPSSKRDRPNRVAVIRISPWLTGITILVFVAVLNFTLFNEQWMLSNQVKQQKEIGLFDLNKKLYTFYIEKGFEGKVFSKYPYFRFLPELRDYWAPERTTQGVCYILEDYFVTKPMTLGEIKTKIKAGEYKIMFTHNQFKLIKTKNNLPGK